MAAARIRKQSQRASGAGLALGLSALLAAGLAWPGERVMVEMGNGDRISGELLKRDAERIHLLVGGGLVTVEAKRIKQLRTSGAGDAKPERVRSFQLYSVARRPERDMQSLVEELGPAIAVVKTPVGLGTGWFCNRDGYLVTNHHVVAGERTIRVTLFARTGKKGKSWGRKLFSKVRIVALNAQMDLALLKVEEPLGAKIPQLYLGGSQSVKAGDRVFAIGNPLGLTRSTSQGIVSKVGRNIGGRLFIQTTAPIAPGNSGGPLFNHRGEVIGVVSRGAVTLDGLGFAIPAGTVMEFLDNLEAFAYDEDNPNNGIAYMETPVSSADGKVRFTAADFIRVGHGLCCLNVADLDRDGVAEVVFADNNKSEIGILQRRSPGRPGKRDLDAWDINQLPESKRFELETIPVTSRISSIATGDLNGDGRRDLVFYGDLDGLALMTGDRRGGFDPPRKIDDVQVSGHQRAIRIADLDGDGAGDIFVQGREVFTVFWSGRQRSEVPLDAALRSKLRQFELLDVDGDGRLDVVFFTNSGHYGITLRLQTAARTFFASRPLRSQISGPVRPVRLGKKRRFLALDAKINRLRRLELVERRRSKMPPRPTLSLNNLPVESGTAAGAPVDMADVDGDGKQELLTIDVQRSELVFIRYGPSGFEMVRSPAPRNLNTCRLYRSGGGRTAVFSFSKSDKLFGVSRLQRGKIAFPRPIHTRGAVQWMQLERLTGFDEADGEQAVLLWVEKLDAGQVLRMAMADEVVDNALDGQSGSVDVRFRTLTFGPDAKRQQARLPGKVKRLAFADFNSDGRLDAVVFWAYTHKESLYLGLGEGRFAEVVKQQPIVEDEGSQALLVQDLDGDGKRDVLQVQPGFVRVLKVDAKGRLFVHRQLNWKHGRIDRLAPYSAQRRKSRLVVLNGRQAEIVELDAGKGAFATVAKLDLTGIDMDRLAVGDLDGDERPDLVGWGNGQIRVLLNRPPRWVLDSHIALNASLRHFEYWNLAAADLDSDGWDEVLLFDRRKSAMEVLRFDRQAALRPVMRHRLFTAHLMKQPAESKGQPDQPRAVAVGDVDGNRKPDLVFVLHDRVAIYLQDAK